MDVPAARQVARPGWLNARTILGAVLMLVSFAGGQRILADARTTVAYWGAARDLPRGTEIGVEDLVPMEVQLPSNAATSYAPASSALGGAILERAVAGGELIPTAWLSESGLTAPGREMTVPVPPEHAVGGTLGIGDLVDVFATFAPEGAEAKTMLIARGIEVLGVVETGGLVLDEEAKVGITVAVSPEEATRLAFAIRTAQIDVVRVVGEDDRRPARSVGERDFR